MSSWFPKSSYLVSLPIAFIFSNQSSTQKNQIVLFTWHPQMMKSFWDVLASFFFPRQYTFHSVKSEMQRDPTKRPSYSIPVCLLSLSLSTWEVFGHFPTWHHILSEVNCISHLLTYSVCSANTTICCSANTTICWKATFSPKWTMAKGANKTLWLRTKCLYSFLQRFNFMYIKT